MNHQKLPLPQNSEMLDALRIAKSACYSLVHGNDIFYLYNLCVMFQFCDAIIVKPLI